MKKKLFILLFLCVAPHLWAQKNSFAAGEETLTVEINTPHVLPGEYLFYTLKINASNPLNKKQSLSQVAYVSLIDPNGTVQLTQQIILESIANYTVGQGELFIPASLPTGGYTLAAYTLQMLNIAKPITQQAIAVLNPYSTARVGNVIEKEIPQEFILTVASPKESIQKRSVYTFETPVNLPLQGLFNLSVRKKDMLYSMAYFENDTLENVSIYKIKKQYHPELIGASLSGQIIGSENSSLDKLGVSLSFIGPNMPFKLTTTDANGRFSFPLNAPINSNKAVIRILSKEINSYSIQLDAYPIPEIARTKTAGLELEKSDLEVLKNRSIHNQIENAYNAFKPDLVPLENQPISDFSTLKKTTYILDEYTRFSSFEETVFEIINLINYRKNKAGEDQLYCKGVLRNSLSAAGPLLLLDGIPIIDHTALKKYPAQDIKSIAVTQQQIVIGNQIWNGLVEVSSLSGIPNVYLEQQSLKIWDLKLPALKKTYYQNTSDIHSNIPNFSHQLVWLPNQTSEQIKAFNSFYTGDLKGVYEIKITGEDAAGKSYFYSKTIKIE